MALGVAATAFVASAIPGSAQEEPSLKLSVTPYEIKAGASVEVSSLSPCRDEKETGYVTVVDIEVWRSDELISADTVTAYDPADPAKNGDWSWTYQTTKETHGPGVYTVAASCFLLDTDAVDPEPSRRHLGDYYKSDFLVELDTEVHPSDPETIAPPSSALTPPPPIGSGFAETMDPVLDAPPPATAVPGRPTFAG